MAELLIAEIGVEVPGLKPDVRSSTDDKIIRPSNLDTLAEKVDEILSNKPWYRLLLDDVSQSKKSAIFTIALGTLTIFVATAAGFEFGIRHGQDLKHLPKILSRQKE